MPPFKVLFRPSATFPCRWTTPRGWPLASGQDLEGTDQIPQEVLDAMLWHYRHGYKSAPPPPGPNSSAEDSQQRDADSIDRKAIGRQIRRAAAGG